jgi:hypothetical protein
VMFLVSSSFIIITVAAAAVTASACKSEAHFLSDDSREIVVITFEQNMKHIPSCQGETRQKELNDPLVVVVAVTVTLDLIVEVGIRDEKPQKRRVAD